MLPNGLVFGGELLCAGQFGIDPHTNAVLSANISGIWNDPVNGNTAAGPALFQGTLSTQPQAGPPPGSNPPPQGNPPPPPPPATTTKR